MQCLPWDRVSAISELIYDNPVYQGKRTVTMVTNLGTKIAINAFLWEMARMWLLLREIFVVSQSRQDIFDCKGLADVAMSTIFFVKIGKNSQKFSSMRHVNAKFGFGIGVQLQANSHMTLPDTTGKERYHSNQCWTKIAINAFLRQTPRIWLLIIGDKGALPWQQILRVKFLWMHVYEW